MVQNLNLILYITFKRHRNQRQSAAHFARKPSFWRYVIRFFTNLLA